MARYTTYAPEEEPQYPTFIAKLNLENWHPPEHWEGDHRASEEWPQATIESLIHLFTGNTSEATGQEGIEIPDQLGWHIAHLIELWQQSLYPIDNNALNDAPEALAHIVAAKYKPSNNGSLLALQGYESELHHIERVDKIRDVVQKWYADGIALYHTLSLAKNGPITPGQYAKSPLNNPDNGKDPIKTPS